MSRRRNTGRPFALMAGLLALLLLGGGVLGYVLQRGGDATETTTAAVTSSRTDTGTTTSTTTLRTPVLVYFVRDGKVGAAGRSVPKTPAIGTAALEELVAGPTAREQAAGLSTALPASTTVDSLDVSGGLATVKLGNALDPLATAQVVFTLTQFPSVTRVAVNGGPPQTRKALEDLSPIILVEEPTPNETVTSPFEVAGTSNTFEATLQLQLTDAGGKVLAKRFLTATSGTGTRGTFSGQLAFTASPGTRLVLHAYEDSAEDGSRIHEVTIPLVAG